MMSEKEWNSRRDEWLPSTEDKAYIDNLNAQPVFEPGKIANWIAPPRRGVNNKPIDFEYVRLEE